MCLFKVALGHVQLGIPPKFWLGDADASDAAADAADAADAAADAADAAASTADARSRRCSNVVASAALTD